MKEAPVRRVTKLAAVLATVTLGLAACSSSSGGDDATATGAATSAAAATLKVGMAFDTGGRGDGTFNDLAVAGLDKVKSELGATTQELSPKEDGSDRADLLSQLADDGFNPIIGVGFSYGEAMETVAKEYPDVTFIRIDGGPSELPNVAVKTFKEEQGSFLVGAAAALKSKTGHIGFIGGNESALITKFYAGYVQGAKASSLTSRSMTSAWPPARTPRASATPPARRWPPRRCTRAAPTSSTPLRVDRGAARSRPPPPPASWRSASTPTSTRRSGTRSCRRSS